MIILVAGYRRTGKDTFFQELAAGRLERWQVVSISGQTLPLGPVRRLAFADLLKAEVRQKLGLPPDFDDKDARMADGRTFREHCIELAMTRRAADPDHWVRLAFQGVDLQSTVVVTDWRFLNELTYARNCGPVLTIRVFRQAVPIPPLTDPSEHELDGVRTDLLLLPIENCQAELQSALRLFPQYR